MQREHCGEGCNLPPSFSSYFINNLEPVTHVRTQCQPPRSLAVLLLCVPCVKCVEFPPQSYHCTLQPSPNPPTPPHPREPINTKQDNDLRNDKFYVIVTPSASVPRATGTFRRERDRRDGSGSSWVKGGEENVCNYKRNKRQKQNGTFDL